MEQAVFPRFFMKTIDDPVRTKEEGHACFKDVEYVEIRVAGDAKNILHKKVDEGIKQRFPEHYNHWKAGQKDAIVGTPLREWPQLPGSKVKELQGLNIFTVEALAELNDGFIHRIGMNGRQLVSDAKAFLAGQTGKDTEIDGLKLKISALEAENNELKEKITELTTKKPRGRPKKTDEPKLEVLPH